MSVQYSTKSRRRISKALLFVFLFQILTPSLAFAGEGPAQPEAAQFEPIDTTDLVNLFTGNFNYNVPLLEVPGPEGGWPISMSYHAGVGPNTEATWVGLGWTLNPGAINRFVNGYPDDWHAGSQVTEIDYQKRKTWGVGIGISYGPVGMSLNYNSREGFGANATFSLIKGIMAVANMGEAGEAVSNAADGAEKAGSIFSFDMNLSIGTSGVGLSANAGVALGKDTGLSLGISAGVHSSQKPSGGIGLGYSNVKRGKDDKLTGNSMSLLGASFSSGGDGASFSAGGVGLFQASSTQGTGSSRSWGISIPIGLFTGVPLLGISLSFSKTEWWLHEIIAEKSFGSLHQLGSLYSEANKVKPEYTLSTYWNAQKTEYNVTRDAEKYMDDDLRAELKENDPYSENDLEVLFNLRKGSRSGEPPEYYDKTKVENISMNYGGALFSSEDNYSLNAQGLSGSFRPYFLQPYKLYNNEASEKNRDTEGKYTSYGAGLNNSENIVFRFDGEQGGNFITLNATWDKKNYNIKQNHVYYRGGKKIQPAVNTVTGELLGFRVTTADGKIYEFFRPVMSSYEKSVQSKSGKEGFTNTFERKTPYATAWLLTGIKGSDYIDRKSDGFSHDDWGFWVRFRYEIRNTGLYWRTPYNDFKIDDYDQSVSSYSEGFKERSYLKTIETASHIAFFEAEERRDNIAIHTDIWAHMNSYDFKEISSTSTTKTYDVIVRKVKGEKDIEFIPIYKTLNECVSYRDYFSDYNDYSHKKDCKNPQCVHGPPNRDVCSCNEEIKIDNVKKISSASTHTRYRMTLTHGLGANFKIRYFEKKYKLKNLQAFPKKLSKIALYKKLHDKDGDLIYNPQAYKDRADDTQLESVEFTYDYSLLKGAPNSDGNGNGKIGESSDGKLTLKEIVKRGLNGTQSLPSMKFYYNYAPYNKEHYNHWNGYSSTGNNYASFDKKIADSDAGKLNLGEILTSLGSKISIEYESDQLEFVKDKPVGDGIFTWITPPDKKYRYAYITKNKKFYRQIRQLSGMRLKVKYYGGSWARSGSKSFKYTRYVYRPYEPESRYFSAQFLDEEIVIADDSTLVKLPERLVNPYDRLFYHGSYKNNLYEPTSINPGLAIIVPQLDIPVYEGGHRVKSISITSGRETRKTLYSYKGGTTAVLPQAFSQSDLGGLTYHYIGVAKKFFISWGKREPKSMYLDGMDMFLNYKFNKLGPSPSVGYEKVEVMDVDENGNVLNGKTTHEFVTAKDAPFIIESTETSTKIIDKSGSIGRMKSTSIHGMNPNGVGEKRFPVLKKDELIYAYSSEIMNDATKGKQKVYDKRFSNSVGQDKPLGLTEQKYITENNDAILSNHRGQKHVSHIRENVYMLGTKSILYFYDKNWNLQNSFITKSENIGFDAVTGKVIRSQAISSKKSRVITENYPAYWKYTGMQEKNMLTQLAEKRSYTIPKADQTSYSAEIPRKYLQNSSVTTWEYWKTAYALGEEKAVNEKDPNAGIWRQNDTYVSTKTGENFEPFNFASEDNEDFPEGWKRTSNITKYDRFSHPVEERGLDGTYTSSIYGADALPIAIAKNARRDQIQYYNFEKAIRNSAVGERNVHNLLTHAKTGDYSHSGDFNVTFSTDQEYTISYWYKTGNQPWEYEEFNSSSGSESLSKGDKIDDVRIYPKNATMSTFTYDPLTWKVTAITDANNVTTYYEYDDAGRLIKVIDEDDYILQSYEYKYGREEANR
jgi:YD repeat-containing protein